MKVTSASSSIHDLRRRLLLALASRADALLNIIDSLTTGPRLLTPSELPFCPICSFQSSSLYSPLRSACDQTTLDALRRARLNWWENKRDSLCERTPRTGKGRVRLLDSTPYPRPRTETVGLGYLQTASGMKVGDCLSLLSQQAGEGSWFLPLGLDLLDPTISPRAAAMAQLIAFVKSWGWEPDEILAVDAA